MFDKLIIRRLLNIPAVYQLFGKVIRSKNDPIERFCSEYIGNISGLRILDLGCGPADILQYIHDEKLYVGIDNNMSYIEQAKRKFADRGSCQFCCIDLNSYSEQTKQKFDVVLMKGVMHHIDDKQVEQCLKSVKRIIAENGKFVSQDPCYTKGMNPIARLLCMLDRGRYVRYVDDIVRIQKKYWKNVNFEVKTDGLRLPYSRILFLNKDCE